MDLINVKHIACFCKFLKSDFYPLIQKSVESRLELEHDVSELENAVSELQSFIRARDVNLNGGHILEDTIRRLRDLAMDAEDELALYVCEARKRSFSGIGPVIDCSKVAKKTQRICKGVRELLQKAEKELNRKPGEEPRDDSSEHLRIDENPVGFDGHAKNISNMLLDNEPALLVVSIVGMAGQGKTTLAKKVYNDPTIRSCFDYISWALVSQRYTRRNVLQDIIYHGGSSKEKDTDDNVLEEKLRSTLKEKKCLILLDDVWRSDPCDDLVRMFGDNRNASRIMITSRFKIVSAERHSPRLYELSPLIDEQSWELLSKNVGRPLMQRMAAKKGDLAPLFKGLPLSVVAFSRFLQLRDGPPEMDSFDMLSSYLWEDCSWKKSLALSYEHLPFHLKSCFLYFGVFPVDNEIPARHLTRLWVAEGFVESKDNVTLEETAEGYLEELVKKNLIQVSKRRCDGGIKSFRIHDALHAFCKSKFKDEFPTFKMISSPSSLSSPLRRLSININRENSLSSNHIEAKMLRSFLNFSKRASHLSGEHWKSIYDGFPVLRVLDLGSIKIETFPPEIKRLLLLRYLRFNCANASGLPKSICELSNLQTLEVTAPKLKDPPKDIWDMKELRHLYYKPGPLSLAPKSGGNNLNNLQTLVSVTPKSCVKGVLSKMPNLTLLTIVGDLQQLGHLEFGGGLKSLSRLRTLKLEHLSKKPMTSLPSKIHFPEKLTKLVLSKTELSEDPMEKLQQRIPNLKVLKLNRAYKGKELNCESHKFPKLQSLSLKNMGIEKFKISTTSMPGLNILIIKECESLQDLPLAALNHISTFQKLELERCPVQVETDAKEMKRVREQLELRIDDRLL